MNRLEEMQKQFEAFHKNNPHIWEEFVKHTFQMIAKKPKYSAKAIFEVIRWSKIITSDNTTDFKISNNPEHEGFFQIKKQTSVYKVANNWGDPTPEDV